MLCIDDLKDKSPWILDSGYSFYTCPNKSWFESYQDQDGGEVVFGNNKTCQVMGIGIIKLILHDATERVLYNIIFVP